jgi:hypothetical protein
MNRSPWVLVLAAIAACGSSSGSGVSSSKRLSSLSADERDKVCAYGVDLEDAPRTVKCDDGSMVTLRDKSACLSGFATITLQCTATVGDAEFCFQAIADDPCKLGVGACTALYTCVLPTGA